MYGWRLVPSQRLRRHLRRGRAGRREVAGLRGVVLIGAGRPRLRRQVPGLLRLRPDVGDLLPLILGERPLGDVLGEAIVLLRRLIDPRRQLHL